MSRGLASFPEHQRRLIAKKRVRNKTKGLGYWGAQDFLDRQTIKQLKNKPAEKLSKKEIQKAVELHTRGKI